MDQFDLLHTELRELRKELKCISEQNAKFLEKLARHETDLTWLKGSSKILITTIIAGVSGLIIYWLRGSLL